MRSNLKGATGFGPPDGVVFSNLQGAVGRGSNVGVMSSNLKGATGFAPLSWTDVQLVNVAGVPAPAPNFKEALEFKEGWIARGKRNLTVLAMCHQPYSRNLNLEDVKEFLRSCQAEHFDDALRVGAFKTKMSADDLYKALKDKGGDQ